jgi:hypothetical protein
MTIANINGHELLNAVDWQLTSGTSPFVSVVEVTPDAAGALTGGRATPLSLTIAAEGHGKREFKSVYVLQQVPGAGPSAPARLVVADRRWLWPSYHFKRSFNMTREVGTKRLVAPNQLEENVQLEPDVVYQPWSLLGGVRAWTPKTMLQSLAAAIEECESGFTGKSVAGVDVAVADRIEGVPIQDIELDGPLDECIERAMGYLPGVSLYVDPSGVVRFYDTADQGERAVVKADPIFGTGYIAETSFARLRPSAIRVLFDVKVELCFRWQDAGPGGTSAVAEDGLYADNVAPVPDPTVTVNGQPQPTGTWLRLETLYTAWGSNPLTGAALTTQDVRICMVPYLDMWSRFVEAGLAVPDADWASRIACVQTHFRQTFQINRRWMDRIRELRAERVGTINPERGTRGKAPVYSDYAYLSSQRSQTLEVAGSQDGAYIVNVAAYPSDDVIGTNTRAAAATLSVIDAQQGVLSIDFLADRFRVYESALPSQVEMDGDNTTPGSSPTNPGPTPYLGFSTRPIGWDMIGRSGSLPALCARDKKAFIVTAVPGSPNDKAGLVAVEIKPTDTAIPNFPGKNACRGPVMEIRISPSVETARVPWQDQFAEQIAGFFTRKAGDGPMAAQDISNLIMNLDGEPTAGASLKGIAQAAAAALWLSFRDRPVGTMQTGFNAAAEPAGNLSTVAHSIAADSGVVTTGYSLPDRIQPLDVNRYLSEGVKRIIHRTVNPGQ